MKILITGGAGFLGSALGRRLLKEGNEIWCLDNFITGRKGNIADLLDNPSFYLLHQDVIEPVDISVDQIYNLACPASPENYQQDPVHTAKTCFLGALNMLELAKKYDATILQASTSEIYGDPLEHPQTETYKGNVNSIGIRSCYDEGKRIAETLFFDHARQYGTKIRVVRIFNTYGPGMDPKDGRVVSNFIMQVLRGEKITIYGDGTQTRCFCYVDDMTEALVRMMNNPTGFTGPVNLGNPVEMTVAELANTVIQLTGSGSTLAYRELPQDDPVRRRPDISLAKKMLGWEPKVSLAEGLEKTISYFKSLSEASCIDSDAPVSDRSYKITVVGAGYVGLSLSVLLAQHNEVTVTDIIPDKVEKIRHLISPVQDEYIENYLAEAKAGTRCLNLTATTDASASYAHADFIIIAVSTNYDTKKNCLDCSAVESVLKDILQSTKSQDKKPLIVVKSTVPIGYTEQIKTKIQADNIIFCPEFLRETKALYDNLYPSRIIIGTTKATAEKAAQFANLLQQGAIQKAEKVLFVGNTEAEAIKLFSNTYLAMRVSYFNELDTFAVARGLDASSIIKGVCADPRIGEYYNNPSFGYGGYCLPKDTSQLLATYQDIPETLIQAIVESNRTRKQYIADRIMGMLHADAVPAAGDKKTTENKVVGIFRLTMKFSSDNFRESAVQDIINRLKEKGIPLIIYEPSLNSSAFNGCDVLTDMEEFKSRSTIIIANRYDSILDDVKEKVFTRDLFHRD